MHGISTMALSTLSLHADSAMMLRSCRLMLALSLQAGDETVRLGDDLTDLGVPSPLDLALPGVICRG